MTKAKKKAPARTVAKPKATAAKSTTKSKPKVAAVKTTAKAKPTAKKASAAKPKTAVKITTARSKVAVKAATTKAAPTKLTDVEKLKLQIKNLRASLKETTTENELQKKQIVSLTRKNTNLMRKLDTPSTVTKPKARTNKAKPISLALPKQETKLRPKTSTRAKQKAGDSDNEKWVDKWWETF